MKFQHFLPETPVAFSSVLLALRVQMHNLHAVSQPLHSLNTLQKQSKPIFTCRKADPHFPSPPSLLSPPEASRAPPRQPLPRCCSARHLVCLRFAPRCQFGEGFFHRVLFPLSTPRVCVALSPRHNAPLHFLGRGWRGRQISAERSRRGRGSPEGIGDRQSLFCG